MEQTKIRLYGIHLCYVKTEKLLLFQRTFEIVNFNSWIKEEVYNDYNIYLEDKYDIEEFKDLLEEDYYDNIGDWLNEKIRNKLREKSLK